MFCSCIDCKQKKKSVVFEPHVTRLRFFLSRIYNVSLIFYDPAISFCQNAKISSGRNRLSTPKRECPIQHRGLEIPSRYLVGKV